MNRIFVFPGQGSQFVGMGKDLADASVAARDVFQEVDEALSQNLFRLMAEGPESELALTENTQPALMAVSVAITRILEQEAGIVLSKVVDFAAGHSLGEYSALTAFRALDLAAAAKTLKARGRAMQKAVPIGEGAMAAIIGLTVEEVEAVASQSAEKTGGVCAIANDNGAGQIVLSGHAAAIERAIELANDKGARRALPLAVSAPFHCPLMEPAAREMAEVLDSVDFRVPSVPVISNVSVSPETDPKRIRSLLIEQITGRVRWRETIGYMGQQGIEQQVEIGAGKVLSGLAKRTDRTLEIATLNGPEDIESFIKSV